MFYVKVDYMFNSDYKYVGYFTSMLHVSYLFLFFLYM